jgi:serine/threonine protein kinase
MDSPGPVPLRRSPRPYLWPAGSNPWLVSSRTMGLGGAGGDGPVMPAPFSPDPAERPSDHSGAHAPSTQKSTEHFHDPEGVTPLATPVEHSEPPTIISGNRPRANGFDPNIGDTLAGRKLGHFELIESVGVGGMGAVLRARDLDLGRTVALKILPPDMAADPENIVRFRHEARAAARLDHENVARVYYFGEDQGLHFIAFEFVEGDNLRQLMTAHGGNIAVPDAVSLMLQVTAGLAHAAERGLVHRDIKPSNIIVTPDGRAKIVDMGLARNLDPKANNQLTESGVTLGTFDYISPEQAIDPRSADVRSDIYSLGCTFYHALTGQLPVPEGNAAKKLDAQKNIVPPDPRGFNPDIPEDLVAILSRMMAKDADRRYQDPNHLAAHLRSIARRFGVPVGPPSSTNGPAYADPLNRRPRSMHVAWMLTSVAVLALFVIVLANGFRGPAPETRQVEAKGGAGPGNSVDPGPGPGPGQVVAQERRDASTVDELVALLKEGYRNIRLTGAEYDLIRVRDADGHPVDALLTGDDVKLEGLDGAPPVVRVGFSAFDLEGKARSKTLTFRGPGGGKGSVAVHGIRFVFPDRDGEPHEAGLVVAGFDRVTFEECTFTPPSANTRDGDRPATNGAAAVAVVLGGGSASFSRCYFAPGSGGFTANGPGRVTAYECALGPQHSAVRVLRPGGELKETTEVTLIHCSALLPRDGAVVEIGDMVPCVVRAAFCLFAGPDRTAAEYMPTVLRQKGDRADGTKYEADPEAAPNGYYSVAAYADGDRTRTFAQAADENLPIKDTEKKIKYPWENQDPFAWLAPDAHKAFRPNLTLADLRMKADRNVVLGTRYLGPDPLYDFPLPVITSAPRDPTVKVWDPSLAESAEDKDLPPGVYPTLGRALTAVGRVGTLLIRYTGRLPVDPYEFTRYSTNVTIKPEGDSKPILVPATTLKRADGLFKLYAKNGGGRLVLDGLHFRLPAGLVPAVAVLPGGGQLEIRNSVITMEEGEDLTAVLLTDPRREMMMEGDGPSALPSPKVTFENVFVRGKGRLLAVRQSRPFELDVKNTMAALDSNLIDIDPSTIDPSALGSGTVRLNRVTTYLGGSVFHIRGAERKTEQTPLGLAKTDVSATNCVFALAGGSGEPLVRTDRMESREQVKDWLVWSGKDNVYGYDRKGVVLEIRTNDMMPPKPVDGDGWLGMVQEDGNPFAAVRFSADELPGAGEVYRFLTVRPTHFGPPRVDPPRPEGSQEVGAAAEVPVPFSKE